MDLIKKYFPEIGEEQLERFQAFKDEFLVWNDKINCVSRKDTENFEERHILHSLGIAKFVDFPSGADVLDVGSGGGFPGLPLAILYPEVNFHLIDSIGKKIKVIEGVSSALNLKNVRAQKIRSEDLDGRYDFITARAVARAISFNRWVKHLIRRNRRFDSGGIYYLKGGDVQEEMDELKLPYKIWDLSSVYEGEFFETKKLVKF